MNTALYAASATGAEYSTSWTPTGVTVAAQDVYRSDATTAPFYFIPGGTGTNQEIKVSITYTVKTKDSNLSEGFSIVNQTITNKVSLDALQPNKYYTLILHLGLTSVKFEATVADWENTGSGTEQSIWLPSNVVE